MIPLKELQKVEIFKPLSKEMIEELAAIGDITTAKEGDYLFRDGDQADNFYIIKEGKIILEFKQPDGSINTETVAPGMGVGCSSLAGLPRYNAHGRCEESSRFLRWRQSRLQQLFNENHRLGYLLIKASSKKLSNRVSGKLHK
jgi:CRP/FNR family transcriptional regulator, cyclic AMP receptor protein